MTFVNKYCIVAFSAALSFNASGQDRLSRIGGFLGKTSPQPPPNTTDTIGIWRADSSNPIRKLEDKFIDLRPWFRWRDAGVRAYHAKQSYTLRDPLPDWSIVDGEVQAVTDDMRTIVTRRRDSVILINWPGAKKAVTGDKLTVLAKRAGTMNGRSAGGGLQTLVAFDYGLLPTREELDNISKAEAAAIEKAKAEKEQAENAKTIEAKKRAEESRRKREQAK